MRKLTHILVALTALLASGACTVSDTKVPTAAGPSDLGRTLRVTATPDSIPQDGASQSLVAVTVFGPDGQGVPKVLVQLSLLGSGSLASGTLLTGADGKATTIFTAPASANGFATSATIQATATGSDASTANTFETRITLTPTGTVPPIVVVPSSPPPTADFVFSPTSPVISQSVFFNGAASTAAAGHFIAQYRWDFGDGTIDTTSGVSASHQYSVAGTYNVGLTVTDEAGARATKTTGVAVGASVPKAVLSLFKSGGNAIQADGSGSSASGSATIATYRFIWGDGTADTVGAAASVPHDYLAVAGNHTVTLIVTDSNGRTASTQASITTP